MAAMRMILENNLEVYVFQHVNGTIIGAIVCLPGFAPTVGQIVELMQKNRKTYVDRVQKLPVTTDHLFGEADFLVDGVKFTLRGFDSVGNLYGPKDVA